MKRITIPIVIALFFCDCSIFNLKDPESPLVGPVTEDPLNISHILGIVNESAVSMDYRDYFANDVKFEYPPMRSVNGRDGVVNMLNHLRARTSLVVWETEKAVRRPSGNNMMMVDNVPYTVYSGGHVICAGFADFHIVRELEWLISYWKDMPNGGHIPFFEP